MTPDSLKTYLDEEGRLKVWPSRRRRAHQIAALAYLAEKLPWNEDLSEPQVNELLRKWHTFGDWALLRREMFEAGFLTRTPDCRVYRRLSQKDQAGNLTS